LRKYWNETDFERVINRAGESGEDETAKVQLIFRGMPVYIELSGFLSLGILCETYGR